MGPYGCVDLTEIIAEDDGTFLVYRSPDSAEHSADYELIATCATRAEAEEILRLSDGESKDEADPVNVD